MQVHMGIFVIYLSNSFYSIFFLFWREIFLVGPKRKHPGPTIIFLSPLPNQTPSKKFFLLIFSPFFSIIPKIHSTKHTLTLIQLSASPLKPHPHALSPSLTLTLIRSLATSHKPHSFPSPPSSLHHRRFVVLHRFVTSSFFTSSSSFLGSLLFIYL